MSNDINCSSCEHAVFDAVWGEYKCRKKHRICASDEVANGCDQYTRLDAKSSVPKSCEQGVDSE